MNLQIVSQNVIYNNLAGNSKKYVINNLFIQIMSKLGIKPFILKDQLPYDYVVGVDVGENFRGRRAIGGCSVVVNNNGMVDKIIPLDQATSGEILRISTILESINDRFVNLENKRVLILRDGRKYEDEVNDLLKAHNELKVNITFINIIKKHRIFIVSKDSPIVYHLEEGSALLLPHSLPGNRKGREKPIFIENKYVFENGYYKKEIVNSDDTRILWILTSLNYMYLFNKNNRIKLPAPLHYADLYVKARGREWNASEFMLKEGMLYFI